MGTKTKFTRLFIKNRSSQDKFLGVDHVSDKFEELSPGALCQGKGLTGVTSVSEIIMQPKVGRGKGGAPPHYLYVLRINLNAEEHKKLSLHE